MPGKRNTSKTQSNNLLKFVHTADLHLGSPLAVMAGSGEQVASQLARATFKGFENIVDLCIREEVDFLLISGDIYDSADRGIYEQLTFRKYLQRLSDSGIPVYLAFGNHDPLDGWAARIDWPENVHVMSGDEPECLFFRGEDGKEAAIVGVSYRTRETYDNLATRFPLKERDWPFTIGMLHCTLDAGFGHEPYAPCSLNDLVERGYDYWALGHIHKPGVIRRSGPAVVYPGNPQGRDIGESGPRGCCLVSVGRIPMDRRSSAVSPSPGEGGFTHRWSVRGRFPRSFSRSGTMKEEKRPSSSSRGLSTGPNPPSTGSWSQQESIS
ncbi:MAG: Metallophosphoesterase [Methanoculleus marisnigri]|uniref:Metallophosphoesterase n=1 Tax=Methanoculleus marisnigri TaxID=2198 RepID=A0A117MDX2_9EURY|nr:MAG: Metallophosphoesterase [Methanoculleus marisnigri]